jgi:hypothetical protein
MATTIYIIGLGEWQRELAQSSEQQKAKKQEFRLTDFGSRFLAAEGEGAVRGRRQVWVRVCLKSSNFLLVESRSPRLIRLLLGVFNKFSDIIDFSRIRLKHSLIN